LLDFYRVYRAMVRAKIAGLSLAQMDDADRRLELQALCLRYLDYAEQAARLRQPALLMTHGFSGSGKSRLACALAERLPAIRVASDIERKRLAGLDALARSGSEYRDGLYSEDFTRQTYAVLLSHAESILKAGHHVVLDATYLRASDRDSCRALAERLGTRFFILDLQAPEALLRDRVARRLAGGHDPSEADWAVLARQMAGADALARCEMPFVLTLDAAAELDLDALVRVILEHGGADGATCSAL
jgi:predicted kinase